MSMSFCAHVLLLLMTGMTCSADSVYRRGVSLAGPEFGDTQLPGVENRDFTMNSELSYRYFGAKGLSLIRLPLRWERMQPALRGPLDETYLAGIRRNVAWASANGCRIILDVHNYGRYRMIEGGWWREYILDNVYDGSVKVSSEDLADLWRRVSFEFRNEPAVYGYGLMNEPHDLGTADWKATSQALVSAIRSTGDEKLILVAGDSWSSAARWPAVHGPASWIDDPANNFAYEAHLYFDGDASGNYNQSYDAELARNPDMEQVGVRRLAPFIAWCQTNQVRGFLGEYGVPAEDARWLAVLDNFLTALDQAGFGGTYWGAGEWWGGYPLSVQPANQFLEDRPQLAILLRHLTPLIAEQGASGGRSHHGAGARRTSARPAGSTAPHSRE